MSDKPTTWTAERITRIANNNPTLWAEKVAEELNKLNAALAAEREKAEYSLELYEECVAKLAAERKKNDDWRNTERRVARERDAAVEALRKLKAAKGIYASDYWHKDAAQIIDAALAKISI